jgi:hypothetical protein
MGRTADTGIPLGSSGKCRGGSMKNTPKNLPVATATKRKSKKGSSTPKPKKTRSTPRFYEVKIRITAEEFARGQSYFGEQRYLSRFVLDAYQEKLNRAEANDKSARLRILAGNMDLLLPVITEMHKQGKLDFLFTKQEENKNE